MTRDALQIPSNCVREWILFILEQRRQKQHVGEMEHLGNSYSAGHQQTAAMIISNLDLGHGDSRERESGDISPSRSQADSG